MAQSIIDLLNNGTKANKADEYLIGNLISLPSKGSLVITGDIHGHCRNFEKIKTYADLENNPDRHLIFQEIIHGGPEDEEGGCVSYKILFEAIQYKVQFPNRVHFIMGNHDTAFITDSEVMKDGKEMNRSLCAAIRREFQEDSTSIELGLCEFLLSQPLAVKCQNRMWISHSLPNTYSVDKFDPSIMEKDLEIEDLVKDGSAYLLTWGRKFSKESLEKMSKFFDVDIFILGHQPQPGGWSRPEENLIIFTCDHNHGCLMEIDLAKLYTLDELVDCIIPLAAIA
jgi:serine/threonine-protein phosphatase PP1 catalytic subunit